MSFFFTAAMHIMDGGMKWNPASCDIKGLRKRALEDTIQGFRDYDNEFGLDSLGSFKRQSDLYLRDDMGVEEAAIELLRSDFMLLSETIYEMFGDYYNKLRDYRGVANYSFEGFLALRWMLENTEKEDTKFLQRMAYALQAYYMDLVWCEDFVRLKRESGLSAIYPRYKLDLSCFDWAKHPYIVKRYMPYMVKPEGYRCFYYENDLSNVTSLYSNLMKCSYAEAYKEIKKRGDKPLLISDLTLAQENVLMPLVASRALGKTRGELADVFREVSCTIADKFKTGEQSVYTVLVKPTLVMGVGAVLEKMHKEMRESIGASHWGYAACERKEAEGAVYFISQNRIAVCIREDVSLAKVFPSMHLMLRPLLDATYESMMDGRFL